MNEEQPSIAIEQLLEMQAYSEAERNPSPVAGDVEMPIECCELVCASSFSVGNIGCIYMQFCINYICE